MGQSGSKQILIVDDEEGIRHGLGQLFAKAGYAVQTADGPASAREAAQATSVDVAVIDVRLKDGRNGVDLIGELKSIEPDTVVIVVTGYGSIDTAVAAMKEGAADYIVKPIDSIKLLDSVAKNLQLRSLTEENLFLKSELDKRNRGSRQFITANRAIAHILEKADRIKDTPVTVLISGETGTGKEVLARHIHFTSNRREARFVSINCAALSESLMLSELFGHEKGSFTGAIERKPGKFEIADGGTLFLDEIGDMPMDIQAKLLRVLEESSFERVGGTRRISVDVRILAATNRDLPRLISEGRFREDLYYRINIVSFHLPSLRDRRDDVPLLVAHFISKYNEKYNKGVTGLSDDLTAALERYSWPGNVRELENLINQAVLLSEGSIIDKRAFFKAVYVPIPGPRSGPAEVNLPSDIGGPAPAAVEPATGLKEYLGTVVAQHEKALIERTLRENGFNKSKTARVLHVTRKTLARKIARHGIDCNN